MMNQEKIQELIVRSRREDMNAFSLLLSEFQPLVFRLAFRLLCNEDEAKDMVQETFVKVWLALDKYDAKARFSTWLYDAGHSCPTTISSDDNIELTVSNRQLKELILKYTSELSPQQRLIFTLRDIEELDVSEVQAITGFSSGIIKSTLYLARKYIRDKMNQIDTDL